MRCVFAELSPLCVLAAAASLRVCLSSATDGSRALLARRGTPAAADRCKACGDYNISAASASGSLALKLLATIAMEATFM